MLQPPVSTPTARSTAIAMSRIFWYSRSVSVIAGATVTESPVCTPIGSTFSIEQTTTTLSWRSRISSSSYSFQPRIDSSSSTSVTGLASRPCPAILAQVAQIHGDAGARAAEGERRPHDQREAEVGGGGLAVAMVWQIALRGTSPPRPVTISLNRLRSSPALIASMSAPISSTP